MNPNSGPTSANVQADDPVSSNSPYDLYKGTEVWKNVEQAIHDLSRNNDIVEATRRDDIVGYICKQLQR
jgi:hypothetical protein